MELLYLTVNNDTKKIPFELTYGIHKELQDFLLKGNNLFSLFTDIKVSDMVLKICLSERNFKGQIINEFVEFNTLDPEEVITLLDSLYEIMESFFLKHQEMTQKTVQLLNQIQTSDSSQSSLESLLTT